MEILSAIFQGLTALALVIVGLYIKSKDTARDINIYDLKQNSQIIKDSIDRNEKNSKLQLARLDDIEIKMESLSKLVADNNFSDSLYRIMHNAVEWTRPKDEKMLNFLDVERQVTEEFYHEIASVGIGIVTEEFIDKLFKRCLYKVELAAEDFNPIFINNMWNSLEIRVEDFKANIIALLREKFNGKNEQLILQTQQYLYDQMKYVVKQREEFLLGNPDVIL